MKKLLLALFIAMLPIQAQANPLDWVRTHKRFLIMEGAAVTAASIHAAGLHHCLRGDVERCPEEGYGPNWALYGVLTGWSVVVGPALAEKCWNDSSDWKGCYFFAYSGAAAQTSLGIYDFRNYKPKDERDTCHDMRCEDRKFRH